MKLRNSPLARFSLLTAAFAVCAAVAGGCSNTSSSTSTSSSTTKSGSNQLAIISPHPTEIQVEFERAFKAKNPDVKIKWLDQGGSSNALEFVLSRFKTKKDGIDIDLFFGGGMDSFVDMEAAGVLQPLGTDYKIPALLNGVPLRGKNDTWVAAALGGFGILCNKNLATRDNLPVPVTWADMGNPKLQNRIALADPRASGSAHMAYEIILQANGWKKGWEILTAMSGNARSFGTSSGALLDDVASGEAVVAPAIDFYANSKIATAGADKLLYVEPRGQRVITPDPIGMLRGAPNAELAKKFVDFVMSPEGQKIWMLKKGAPGGPQNSSLFRLAALPALYLPIPADSLIKTSPYAGKNDFSFNSQTSSLRRRALDDLIGAVLIDNHDSIKARWKATPDATKITFVPVTEKELAQLAAKWGDQTFRETQKSKWKQEARAHFAS